MRKYGIKLLVLVCLIFIWIPRVGAQEKSVTVHFFWGTGCPFCEKVNDVLKEIKGEYPEVIVKDYQIYGNEKNRKIFQEMAVALGEEAQYLPTVIIGEKFFVGFLKEQTKANIQGAIEFYQNEVIVEPKEEPIMEHKNEEEEIPPLLNVEDNSNEKEIQTKVHVPVWGLIDLANYSLPLITIILGVLDGFNPCAMWVLLFLISALMTMKDRKKMWLLGLIFLFTSAFIYFLFMVAWLEIILVLGMLFWLRLFIALMALFGGVLNLKSYFSKGDGGCKVIKKEKRTKIFKRIRALTTENKLLIAIFGIITLAVSVNMVELICSAGFPVIYTQILAVNELSKVTYYSYLLLYIVFFLLDDIIIFLLTMVTLKMTGISTKYSRFANLTGGILMIIIGVLLIVKPSLLMFG